jgi:hypothetical protein
MHDRSSRVQATIGSHADLSFVTAQRRHHVTRQDHDALPNISTSPVTQHLHLARGRAVDLVHERITRTPTSGVSVPVDGFVSQGETHRIPAERKASDAPVAYIPPSNTTRETRPEAVTWNTDYRARRQNTVSAVLPEDANSQPRAIVGDERQSHHQMSSTGATNRRRDAWEYRVAPFVSFIGQTPAVDSRNPNLFGGPR